MERLTERTNEGMLVKENRAEGAWKTLYQCYGAEPTPRYENCDEGYCAMETLAEYEDTGITPGQIREIDRLYAEKCKELAECRKSQLTGAELGNMERLTIEYCGEHVPKDMCSIDRLGGADDCDLCCEYCKATEEGNADCRGCAINQCFNKLGQYEDLEEQGKLLKLPCAVGDTVYVNHAMQGWSLKNKDRPYKAKIVFIGINKANNVMNVSFDNGRMLQFWFSDIGKTVFLTREEAEAALKGSEDKNA